MVHQAVGMLLAMTFGNGSRLNRKLAVSAMRPMCQVVEAADDLLADGGVEESPGRHEDSLDPIRCRAETIGIRRSVSGFPES
jgi:hypothetical protein